LFKKNGIVQKWFYDEIKADPQFADMPEIKLAFNWRGPNKTTDIDSITPTTEFYFVTFNFNGPIDMTTRNKMMSDLEKDYKSQIVTRKGADNNLLGYTIGNIRFHGFLAMKRRIDAFTIPISDLVINWYDNDRFRCDLTYRKNADTGNYEIDEKATN
jgi:hypothetical protein